MRRNYFWGLLLIVIGGVFFIEQILYIDIPVFTIICSFVLIYWGIDILLGNAKPNVKRVEYSNHGNGNSHDSIFTNDEIKATGIQDKFDIIFSNSMVDLTTLPIPTSNRKVKVDCIFSRALVKIDTDIPALIKVGAVFSSAYLPNGTSISFGDYTYATRAYNQNMPYYAIKVDVVFGHLDVVEVEKRE